MSRQPHQTAPSLPGDAPGFFIDGHKISARSLCPGLYVVATPIGNLGDITVRALATLAAADLIACEDTRVSRTLVNHYGISTRLVAYHDHNAHLQRPKLLAALAEGKAVALVSDAGTPLVSDPGYRLVSEAVFAGRTIIPIPGASSVLAALVTSGLPSDAFLFVGFLSSKQAARRKRLAALAATPATLIFFESPRRLAASLADMAEKLGAERQSVVARELTKKFETVRRDSLAALAEQYENEAPPKGEVVVLVGPPNDVPISADEIDTLLIELLTSHSIREAAAEAVAQTGLPRRDLYQRALALKKEADDGAA